MKKSDRLRKESEETMLKIRVLTRHIRNVEDNCLILGEKLIGLGEIDLGRQLIANGYVHDSSKFFGIEWENLTHSSSANTKEENAKLKMRMAIHHHRSTNPHHFQYWNGIEKMPDVYLAEMTCDIKARSEEFGTSLVDYIDNVALNEWGITKEHEIYKKINKFIKLLCESSFQEIK